MHDDAVGDPTVNTAVEEHLACPHVPQLRGLIVEDRAAPRRGAVATAAAKLIKASAVDHREQIELLTLRTGPTLVAVAGAVDTFAKQAAVVGCLARRNRLHRRSGWWCRHRSLAPECKLASH